MNPFKKKTKERFDTSVEALRDMGIDITDEQYMNLCTISMLWNVHKEDHSDAYFVILILKLFGLLPTKDVNYSGDNKPRNDGDNYWLEKGDEEWFRRNFGRFRKQ